jgi:ABC-type transport system substrate-binding protein
MSFAQFEGLIEGLDEAIAAARREKRGLDFAAPIAGIKALDARTLQIRLTRPDPTFIYGLAYAGWSAVPREVVEAEAASSRAARSAAGPTSPSASSPPRACRWCATRRSSGSRGRRSRPSAKPDDPILAAMRGVMVPAVDRIEMTRIPEASTAVLALQKDEIDFIAFVDPPAAFDGTELKPALKAAGISAARARAQGSCSSCST